MYAVIKAGGKQHKVQPGDVIEVELVHGGHDEAITFTPLLVVDDDGKTHYGKELAKAQVKAKLVGQEKGDKVKIFKYRPKTGYARRQGHRQMYTLVEIQEVALGKRAPAKKAEEGAEPELETVPAPRGGKGGRAASAGTTAPKSAKAAETPPTPEEEVEGASAEPQAEAEGAASEE
ncbi:MAG TPA: 50S ribosomal protein L21 [Actinomycetota bacterium]|jgi:large subunit ribosomal protein L21